MRDARFANEPLVFERTLIYMPWGGVRVTALARASRMTSSRLHAGTAADWRRARRDGRQQRRVQGGGDIMVRRSAEPTAVQAAAAQPPADLIRARQANRAAIDQASSLARSARAFAARCHALQRRESDGAPFIEHPLEVARLLLDAGCSDVVVAAGLLHDVVEDTPVSLEELRACFGAQVATLVKAVTEDPRIQSYRRRKRMLREQVRSAGGDAALVFAADKIAKVRELACGVTARGQRVDHHRSEHGRHLRLEHYQQSLAMLQHVIPRHPLVTLLEHELDVCSVAIRRETIAGRL